MRATVVGCTLWLMSAAAQTAHAQTWSALIEGEWYWGIRAGFTTAIDTEPLLLGRSESIYGGTPRFSMADGLQSSFAVGNELLDDLYVELEIGYLTGQSKRRFVEGHELREQDRFALDADVNTTFLMANLMYEATFLNWWADPYIRGGIGVAHNRADAELDLEYNASIWERTRFENQQLTDHAFPTGKATEFAWSTAVGFKRSFGEKYSMRLEYSLMSRGAVWTEQDANRDYVLFPELRSQQFLLGFEKRFR